MSPRPLKTVLDALSKVEYIKPLKNAYALDHLGLKFKQNIIKSIMSGRTDLSGPLTNREDYETELIKGHSTIYYNTKETLSRSSGVPHDRPACPPAPYSRISFSSRHCYKEFSS